MGSGNKVKLGAISSLGQSVNLLLFLFGSLLQQLPFGSVGQVTGCAKGVVFPGCVWHHAGSSSLPFSITLCV